MVQTRSRPQASCGALVGADEPEVPLARAWLKETQNTAVPKYVVGNGVERRKKRRKKENGMGERRPGSRFYQNPKKFMHSCGKLNLYYYLPSTGD